MSELLDCVPALAQRQDSVTDQLYDLYLIANKMGMRDAADIIKERIKDARLRFGCYVEFPNGVLDDCVLDFGRPSDCSHCEKHRISKKEDCEYWRMVAI